MLLFLLLAVAYIGLFGSVIMGLGSGLPISVESAAVTNIFELILLAFLVWTKIHFEKKQIATERGPDSE